MKKFQHILFAMGCVLFVYIGSYLVLSVYGRFEPAAIGLNGVKWYAWAPKGFVHDYRWNSSLRIIYLPLWIVDTRFWHKSDEADGGKYPVDEVSQKDIGNVYRSWKR